MTTAEQDTREQVIREAIAAAVRTVATGARVEPVWVMGLVVGENANAITTAAGVIHAYTVTRIKGSNTSADTPTTSAGTGNPLRRQTAPVVLASSMTFRVKGIFRFKHGGESGEHSENVFKQEVERVVLHLAALPRLGLDHTVTGHAQIQIANEGFSNYGKQLCHVSDLEITVQLKTTVRTN